MTLDDLECFGPRQRGAHPDERRPLLGPEIGLSTQEFPEIIDIERGVIGHHQRRHDPVADGWVRNAVHRHLGHTRVAHQHPFYRRGAEVLAVHPHPVTESPREVQVARVVEISEIAAVVHPADHPLCLGIGILVVAAELSPAGNVHQFADHAGRTRLPCGDIEDRKIVGDRTQ